MRVDLSSLQGRTFDVCVIGAGVNGASAAQHLAAAGYSVLLVEKGDYGSGSSSRSSRLLHCGLRYLAPGASIFEFLRHPSRLQTALRMARLAMEARRQLVQTAPERVRPLQFHFPIWDDSVYRPWQLRLGLGLLAQLAPGDVPLGHRMLSPAEARSIPLVGGLRDWDRLQAIGAFCEYQFEWPERLCVDAVLDAERLGAVVRNYTSATKLTRRGEQWEIELGDVLAGDRATVSATLVLNMAGIWIDRVNNTSGGTRARKILGTKGIHIMVQLPPDCADKGVVTYNRRKEPLYCIPWRGMHYFGPTETVYEGNPDDIRAEDDEIEDLLAEANHLLPSLKLRRDDILFTWAGVRPLSYDPALPMGKRSRDVHDLAADGMPGVLAMTAGPVMTHRSAGTEMTEIVRKRLAPSRPAQAVDYSARRFPDNQNSPPIVDDWTEAKFADLVHAARHEHATSLVDLMFRRVGAGWTKTMGHAAADRAAEAVATVYGWDQARTRREAQSYREHLLALHRLRTDAADPLRR
ncbi:MAG: FAD-dependent oxidoreductase [Alphaproteobacteria bacterium]|nr:FAD-dependent oxidoreductase [Alphaproteobacteria bacterium]